MSKTKQLLCVQIFKAKPNKMFTQDQTDAIRFLRFNQSVACAKCGKKKKMMWTALYQFKVANMGSHFIEKGEKSHHPLTPVCDDHLLSPDVEAKE